MKTITIKKLPADHDELTINFIARKAINYEIDQSVWLTLKQAIDLHAELSKYLAGRFPHDELSPQEILKTLKDKEN